jgi:uncharacterized Tic20 family protein
MIEGVKDSATYSATSRPESERLAQSTAELSGGADFIEAVLPIVLTSILGFFVVWRRRRESTQQTRAVDRDTGTKA